MTIDRDRVPSEDPASSERLLRLAAAGEEIPPDLLRQWGRTREARVERLRELDADEVRQSLLAEMRDIEGRVESLEQVGSGEPRSQILGVLDLGERIRRELGAQEAQASDASLDPLALVEEEIGWVRRSARDLGRWDPSLGAVADEVLARAEKARAALTRQKLLRFEAERAAPVPEATPLELATRAWHRFSEACLLEGEIGTRAARGGDGALEADLRRLREMRTELHAECAAALRDADPVELGQFLHQAVADLVDYASVVVSERGGGQLEEGVRFLDLLSQRIEALVAALGSGRRALRGNTVPPADRKRARKDLKALARLRRRTRTARREAETDLRMERALGPKFVRLAENVLFFLLLVFLGLVIVEWRLPEDSPYVVRIHTIDLVLCCFFQIDFFVRWGFARWSGGYFLRHFFFESLPAIPYGFIFHHLRHAYGFGAVEEARLVIFVRLLRSRSVFLLVIRATRVFRLLFFSLRGLDRAVERLRGVIDRDIVLFEPRAAEDGPDASTRGRLLALEARRQKLLRAAYADLPLEGRSAVLVGYLQLLTVEAESAARLSSPHRRGTVHGSREVRLEEAVSFLSDCDEASVTALLGYHATHRAARWLRFLDVPIVRSLPVVRRLVPAGRLADPPAAVAAAARALGELLQNVLGAFRFWGDLDGITTGPQVLDRIASTLIAATKRPAFRLLGFGALFVFAKLMLLLFAEILNVEFPLLETAFTSLARILGLPLLILGSVCLVLFLGGKWAKRMAGEALDIYLRTADAHFYPLLKRWKVRRSDRDLRAIFRSVFLPELKLRSRAEASEEEWIRFLRAPLDPCAPGAGPSGEAFSAYAEDRKNVALLYGDFLDGPILHRLDDKTSVQLLGNLVMHEIRVQTLRMSRKELRRLERLDLGKDRIVALGPYFWFRFMTESLAIETAKLVMEYNTSCIPIAERNLASAKVRRRFEEFLEVRRGPWVRSAEARTATALGRLGEPLATRYFTAADFLDRDPSRELETESKFGEDVLAAIREDRRRLIREIFGTRPYHLLPRAERIVNPYVLYQRYLSGFRVFFLPLTLTVKIALLASKRLWRLVAEVLGKAPEVERRLPRTAGFDVAVRKLNRMRKPFFIEALRLRAAVDVEYLGLKLPGFDRHPEAPSLEQDLDSIGASNAERKPLEVLRAEALKDLRRFRTFLAQRGWRASDLGDFVGSLDPSGALYRQRGEVVRALVTAFVTDHAEIRTKLTAPERCREFVEASIRVRGAPHGGTLGVLAAGLLRFTPRGRRRGRMLAEYLERTQEFRGMGRPMRKRLERSFLTASSATERILALALEEERNSEGGRDSVLGEMRRVAMEFPSWTRKVITARAVQAITVLDVQSYRDLVHELGEYDAG